MPQSVGGEAGTKSKCVPKLVCPTVALSLLNSHSCPLHLSVPVSVCLSLWSELGTDPNFKVAGEYRLTWIIHLLSLTVMEEEMDRAGTRFSWESCERPTGLYTLILFTLSSPSCSWQLSLKPVCSLPLIYYADILLPNNYIH